jgi:hypothetical protein
LTTKIRKTGVREYEEYEKYEKYEKYDGELLERSSPGPSRT